MLSHGFNKTIVVATQLLNMINYRKELRKAQQLAKRQADLSGTGSYLFENNTRGDFHLPRPTKDNIRVVKLGGQFIGDTYYFGLLKSGEIRLVRNLNEVEMPNKLFVYKNYNRDEVKLPEPNRDGQLFIPPTGEFVGDNRFFPLLKQGKLKLVKEVESQVPQDKLLTEVPPTVTREGMVEFVKVDDDKQLTEEQRKKKEKVLSESPLEGVKLLLG